MIRDLAVLLACQLAGEIVARGLALPVPGPVLGMAFLAAGLVALSRRAASSPAVADAIDGLGRTADRLLATLGLLFVPAGVGVVRHLDLVAAHGLALGAALVGSVVATLLVSVAAFRLAARAGDGATGDAGDA